MLKLRPPPTNRGAVNTALRSPPVVIDGAGSAKAALEVSLHWLTATTQAVDVMHAVGFLSDYLGHGPEVKESGQWGYTSSFVWAGGLKLLDNENRPEMGVCLVADGSACEFHGFDKLAHVYQSLQFKATRADFAADNCGFEPSDLRDHWHADNVRTVCKPMTAARSDRADIRTCQWLSSPDGDTFYMGSRSSTQYGRCYNQRGPTRFEMELKKERAAQALETIFAGASLSEALGAAVNQFVAFIDPSTDQNRSRCTLLPWWREFLDALSDSGCVTRLEPRPEPTIDRLRDWIEGQVAASLYVYETVFGKEDSHERIRRELRKRGLEQAKPKHHALIDAAGGWLSHQNLPEYRFTNA